MRQLRRAGLLCTVVVVAGMSVGLLGATVIRLHREAGREGTVPAIPAERREMLRNFDAWINVFGFVVGAGLGFGAYSLMAGRARGASGSDSPS